MKIIKRIKFLWNYNKSLNRRAAIEQYLFDCANGSKPLPDKEKCRDLALQLGTPIEYQKK